MPSIIYLQYHKNDNKEEGMRENVAVLRTIK